MRTSSPVSSLTSRSAVSSVVSPADGVPWAASGSPHRAHDGVCRGRSRDPSPTCAGRCRRRRWRVRSAVCFGRRPSAAPRGRAARPRTGTVSGPAHARLATKRNGRRGDPPGACRDEAASRRAECFERLHAGVGDGRRCAEGRRPEESVEAQSSLVTMRMREDESGSGPACADGGHAVVHARHGTGSLARCNRRARSLQARLACRRALIPRG